MRRRRPLLPALICALALTSVARPALAGPARGPTDELPWLLPRKGGEEGDETNHLDEAKPPSLRRPCALVDPDTPDVQRRKQADAHAVKADELYMAGDPQGALYEIDVAQCYWPHPDYDFMRGVLFASLGECGKARAAIRRFFDSEPNEVDARAARERIGECGPVLPPAPAAEPPSEPAVPEAFLYGPSAVPVITSPRPRVPLEDETPPRAVWRDPVGGALLGAGVPCLIIGTSLLVAARATFRDDPASFRDFEEQQGRHGKLVAAGATFTALGAGAIVGAIVRYSLLSAERKRERDSGRRTASRR